MKSILDSSFRYTPSHSTDLRKTFDRLRRAQDQMTRTGAIGQHAPAPVRIVPLKTGQARG